MLQNHPSCEVGEWVGIDEISFVINETWCEIHFTILTV